MATDKGWAAFRDGLDVVLAIHDRLTALLGPDDLTELVSSLRHLVDIVDASPP